ncbi:HEAT repeat domain-containing protein [Thermodesulfobacteriota bacterium]
MRRVKLFAIISLIILLSGCYGRYGPRISKSEIPADTPAEVKIRIEWLYSSSAKKRVEGVKSLGMMGEKAMPAVPFLVGMLEDYHYETNKPFCCYYMDPCGTSFCVLGRRVAPRSRSVAANTVKALNIIGDPRAIKPLLLTWKNAGHRGFLSVTFSFRAMTQNSIKRIILKNGSDSLLEAMKSKNYEVREASASIISTLRYPPLPTRYGRIRPELGPMPPVRPLTKEASEVEEKSIKFKKMLMTATVEPLIGLLENDEAKEVRAAAAKTLGELNYHRALRPLVAALKDDDEEVREAAANALGYFRDVSAIEQLGFALKDDYAKVRKSAAQALGKYKDSSVVEHLAFALEDDDVYVRRAVVMALKEKGSDAAAFVPALISALNDDDERVRLNAIQALANLSDFLAVRPLIDLLEREVEDDCKPKKYINFCTYISDSLRLLTGERYGQNPASWLKWYEENEKGLPDKIK